MSDINEMNQGPRWYVVHTYSGYENKVKTNIEKIVENRGLGDKIFEVVLPIEITVTTNEKGEQKEVESKVFPCYVFVKMIMTDETWHVVRNITGVTGFVGPGSKPTPLTDAEVKSFKVETKTEKPAFAPGDKVSLVSGIFEGYKGTLQEIDAESDQATVLVSTETRDIQVIVDLKDIRRDEED